MTFGRNVIGSTGRDVQVIADLADIEWKSGGVTIDWGTVGGGQLQIETATVLGTVTGSGNATVVVTAAGMTGSPITLSVAVLNGDTPAVVAGKIRTAMAANANIAAWFSIGGSGADIVLTRIAAAANDATMNISIDNGTSTGLTTAATSTNTLGGTAQVAAQTFPDDTVLAAGQKGLRYGQILTRITSVVLGSKVGYYGPYDPAATDGRQTLARGECFILNRTVLQNNPIGLNVHNPDNPAVFDGGRAWKARILMTTGAHSLAAGPTVAEFETAFPDITYVQNK